MLYNDGNSLRVIIFFSTQLININFLSFLNPVDVTLANGRETPLSDFIG